MEDCNKYLVHLPYPGAENLGCNPQYAALLSGAFAGSGSETTAIAQYTAHNFYTEDYPELHFAYQCITSTEVIHLNLLGEMILNLGRSPKFMTYETNTFWAGNSPVYACRVRPILLADIAGENAAIAHYKKLIQQISCEEIRGVLRRIILDEQKHVEILSAFLATTA